MPTVKDKKIKEPVSETPAPKAFDALAYLKKNLLKIEGTRVQVHPVYGLNYRVNWYNPSSNTIVKTSWVKLVEETGAAEILYLPEPVKSKNSFL